MRSPQFFSALSLEFYLLVWKKKTFCWNIAFLKFKICRTIYAIQNYSINFSFACNIATLIWTNKLFDIDKYERYITTFSWHVCNPGKDLWTPTIAFLFYAKHVRVLSTYCVCSFPLIKSEAIRGCCSMTVCGFTNNHLPTWMHKEYINTNTKCGVVNCARRRLACREKTPSAPCSLCARVPRILCGITLMMFRNRAMLIQRNV